MDRCRVQSSGRRRRDVVWSGGSGGLPDETDSLSGEWSVGDGFHWPVLLPVWIPSLGRYLFVVEWDCDGAYQGGGLVLVLHYGRLPVRLFATGKCRELCEGSRRAGSG